MTTPEPKRVREHWDEIWSTRDADDVSWFQPVPAQSLALVRQVSEPTSSVVDVGAGASRLVDALVADGYSDITLVDVAAPAIAETRARLGSAADNVTFVVGDVTRVDFARTFDVWHDRAVFHFLVEESERARYLRKLGRSLTHRGHVILATFGPEGPEMCSGLAVCRYDEESMASTLGDEFEPLDFVTEIHRTPAGAGQQFVFGLFRRR